MEWELSKENVQPVKTGRNVEVLNDALKAKAEAPTRSSTLEHQRRQYADAIENYIGEDPLVPWIRYIKWVVDAYPEGGARSELLNLLETCTRKFQKDERYRRDKRFLLIWVQYADCSSDPGKVFAFLEANDIGQDFALFYSAYARCMEACKKFSKAEEIYRLGFHRSAQPPGRLESMYKSFLHRMVGRGERKFREEQQSLANGNDENDVQSRSFGPTAVYSGNAVGQQAQRNRTRPAPIPVPRPRARRPENAGLSVFVDPEFGGLPKVTVEEVSGKETSVVPWHHLGIDADNRKENVQQPLKWSDVKIGQDARGQHGRRSDLNILVDEEFAQVSNQKPPVHVSKSTVPSLRLRLEDMEKTRRHAHGLKGSFLDFSEACPPVMAQSSVQYQSESSGRASTQDAAFTRSHAETVFGYDISIVSEDGTEQSFEELRLSVWNETQLVWYPKGKEDILSKRADLMKFEDPSSLLPSMNKETDMAKKSHSSPEDMTRNDSEATVALQSSPSQAKVDGDYDTFNCRADLLLKNSNQRGVNTDITHSGFQVVDHLTREPATADKDILSDNHVQPPTAILPSSSPHQPAIVHFNPSNSLIMQGDETVAIKRFADEVIVLGSDPKVNSIDAVSHHGLVEPTINTKEALADILDMFNKPLECDKARRKSRIPNNTKKPSNNPLAKSGGFQIFVDEDFDLQCPVSAKNEEKSVKPSSGRLSADPVGHDFQTCADENVDRSDNYKTGRDISRPLAQSSGFYIYEDEELDIQRPDNSRKIPERPKASISKSLHNPAIQSSSSDNFAEEDLNMPRALEPHEAERVPKAAVRNASNPSYGLSTFQILVDDDLDFERPLQPAKYDNMQGESTLCSSIRVDDGLQELSLDSGHWDSKIFSQDRCSPVGEKGAGGRLSETGNCGVHGTCITSDRILRQETSFQESASSSEIILKDVCDWHQENISPAKENSLAARVGGISNPALPKRPKSSDVYNLSKSTSEDTTNPPRKQEINGATVPMMVNPWDERNLQDLLIRLKPHMTHYEGFFESTEKYSGSIPISSLRSSNARNKILQLGTSTYRIKGCIGQGAFARVFEVENEDDDLLENAAKLALKFQKPACPWEFYIYRQLDMRICSEDRPYYGYAQRFHLYSDSSFMVCEYGEKGTLQDVVNAYRTLGQRMDEALCMFYTIEMLSMLEILHGVGIIHGDFKPDNLLIRDDSDELEAWTPDRLGCWKSQGLSLIDWGRSIDITLYPEGTQLKGDCNTDSFRCPEMLEYRPWSFQVDTFGLCCVVHCLLHGNYMQIEKTQTAEKTTYRPKTPYKRYWNVRLWRAFFETLINIDDPRDHTKLTVLRRAFEDHLVDNSLGKKLKELLAKQTIMMFSRDLKVH